MPVIGNGDLFAPEDGKAMMDVTGCDGIMLGRGALGRPWMYQQTLDYLRTGTYEPEPELEQRKEVILHHARLICAEKGEYVAMKELRKHIAWYYKGLPNAARMRDMINTVSTMEELQNLLQMKF